MPFNLLLLPLLGGFYFLHALNYTRWRSPRLDGQRLIFESALVAVVLAAAGWLSCRTLTQVGWIRSAWDSWAPAGIPYLGSGIMSLAWGLALPHTFNWLLNRTGRLDDRTAQSRAIAKHGNYLIRLLHSAALEEKPVMLTLDTRKVYIGIVSDAPNLEPHETYVAISPMLSGYRDSNTQELRLSTDYLRAYATQNPRDFRIVISMSAIKTATYFDHAIYKAFSIEVSGPSSDSPAAAESPVEDDEGEGESQGERGPVLS